MARKKATKKGKRIKRCEPKPLTWKGAMPLLILALEAGDEEGKKIVREELMRLARDVDKMNEKEDE